MIMSAHGQHLKKITIKHNIYFNVTEVKDTLIDPTKTIWEVQLLHLKTFFVFITKSEN